ALARAERHAEAYPVFAVALERLDVLRMHRARARTGVELDADGRVLRFEISPFHPAEHLLATAGARRGYGAAEQQECGRGQGPRSPKGWAHGCSVRDVEGGDGRWNVRTGRTRILAQNAQGGQCSKVTGPVRSGGDHGPAAAPSCTAWTAWGP